MQPIVGNVAALAVALIFYTWRTFISSRTNKRRILYERVAYMLWVMADQAETPSKVMHVETI